MIAAETLIALLPPFTRNMSTARRFVVAAVAAATVASAATLLYLKRAPNKGEPEKKGPQDAVGAHTGASDVVAPARQAPEVPTDDPVDPAQRARAMELLQVLKQRANTAFQEGRYEDAIMGYQDCISVTSALGARDKEAVAAEQVIRANVVMAFIKQHQYADARLVATMLLQEDADRGCPVGDELKVKVLYRRGLASKALGEMDAALSDFKAAVLLSPGRKNPMAEREIALLSK